MANYEYFDDVAQDTGPTQKLDKTLVANMRAWLQRKMNQVESKLEEGEEQFWGMVLSESREYAPIRIQAYDRPERHIG